MAEELPESELILMMDRYRGKAYTVTKVYLCGDFTVWGDGRGGGNGAINLALTIHWHHFPPFFSDSDFRFHGAG